MIVDVHLGIVMVNDSDPEKAFGIEVGIDSLLPGQVYPVIAYPIFPPNQVKIPDVGQIVEVIVVADGSGDGEPEDLGTVDYADWLFYTGRIFDSQDGKVPADLQTNYPHRAGLYWNADGTIVYYDDSDGKKEFVISLTDKKNFVRMKEDEIFVQQDQTTVQLKGGKVVITCNASEIGAAGASHPILLGDTVKTDLDALLAAWATAIINGIAALGTEPGAAAYFNGLQSSVNDLIAATANWPSTKHKVDS